MNLEFVRNIGEKVSAKAGDGATKVMVGFTHPCTYPPGHISYISGVVSDYSCVLQYKRSKIFQMLLH